jgi:prepilin-type N-terminal cleavage/methylation domain-containing protein/prepilin-type processing-associated H-X9-DG protein
MKSIRPGSAFTLIEVIVTIGIIALLIALVVPGFWKLKADAKSTACLSNLRQLGMGLNSYLAEHDMTMPTLEAGRKSLDEKVSVIDSTLDGYVTDKRVFACPADEKGFAEKTGTSYYWNVALNGQKFGSMTFLQLTDDQSRIPILSDKEGFHPFVEDKVNILYADGHATKELKFWEPKD